MMRTETESFDKYLESVGFYRRKIPEENDALCRILSIHFYESQHFFKVIRKKISELLKIDYADVTSDLVLKEENLTTVAESYQINFTIWEMSEKCERKLTHLDFEDKVCLHPTADGYYDHIICTSHLQAMAFAQSLFYDTLFTNVFGISNATIAAEKMLEKSSEISTENITRNEENISNPETEIDNVDKRVEKSNKENPMSSGQGKVILADALEIFEHGGIPFPFRCAKLLHSKIFRNVEYDIWKAKNRKDKKYFPTKFYNAILQPGAKCRVAIGPFQMICYIQNINSRGKVPLSSLQPIPIEDIAKEAAADSSKDYLEKRTCKTKQNLCEPTNSLSIKECTADFGGIPAPEVSGSGTSSFDVSVTTPLYHTGYAFKLTNKGVVPLPIDKSLLKTPVLNMVSTHHILPSLVNYNTLKTPVAQEGREVTIAENPEVCQNGTCWVNVAQPYAVQPIELPDLRVPPPVLLPPQESWQNIHNQAQSDPTVFSSLNLFVSPYVCTQSPLYVPQQLLQEINYAPRNTLPSGYPNTRMM
ncbi:UDP-N-acetylglucosamine transferase subunit ALG13-like isoform X2 [Artemia franciscana]|uniref:UDP-N-acetylglucosamine transferase subunit ALG13-like isoform X2 n=1 Tax=Artemia franciscana TaxID=6661 RepID=UPI0032DB3AC7